MDCWILLFITWLSSACWLGFSGRAWLSLFRLLETSLANIKLSYIYVIFIHFAAATSAAFFLAFAALVTETTIITMMDIGIIVVVVSMTMELTHPPPIRK